MAQAKDQPSEPDRTEPFLKALEQAMAQPRPDGQKRGLFEAMASVGEGLEAQLRGAVDEFRQHVLKVRKALPTMKMKVVATDDIAWTQEAAAQERIAALRQEGFQEAGVFLAEGIKGFSFASFLHPAEACTASVCRTGSQCVMDLSSHYPDGTVFEMTDAAAKPGLTNPSWFARQHRPELGPAELVHAFRQSRPDTAPLPVDAEQAARWSEETFARIQSWRAERGGWTRDELRQQAKLGEDAEAEERLQGLWHENRERWLCVWLRSQPDLPFPIDDALESLVIVADDQPVDFVANAWWCGTNDFGVRDHAFEGATPREAFARVNADRGEPLRLVHQKTTAPRADFYLPQPKSRQLKAQGPLADALEIGLAKRDIRGSLYKLGGARLQSRAAAEAVCETLALLRRDPIPNLPKHVHALSRLFQDTAGPESEAFAVLRDTGVPILLGFFDDFRAQADEESVSTLLFLAKILALFQTAEGADRIVEAARAGLDPDGFLWTAILKQFTPEHPHTSRVFAALADPLPAGFIAVALLDAANSLRLEGADLRHPFDTDAGRRQLLAWLADTDPEHFSYAHSATAALPFLSEADRAPLLEAARLHPDRDIQIEAAWAAARLGEDDGLRRLADFCVRRESSLTARRYLTELGREDRIPALAMEPSFAALAEMSQWLAHPNELGRHPDELEIIDQRELPWPPARERKPFWLIRYLARATGDDEEESAGCGLVGSVTFCLFGSDLLSRPPEEAYAVHCYWEMEQDGFVQEEEIEEDSEDHQDLLGQWTGQPLDEARVTRVATLDPQLAYPGPLVGLARADLDGKPVLVLLDGPRSAAIPAREDDEDGTLALKIHIGRTLLAQPAALA